MDWIEIPENKAQYQGVVVLLGASSWSAHNFLQRLSRPDQPLLWIDLSAKDQADPISQGNRLAQAVERAFGSPLFGLGMPFSYGLSVLQKHQKLLGTFAVGIYGAEYAPEMVESLLAMPKLSQPLVLCLEQPPKQALLKKAWVIDLRPAIKAEPVQVSEAEQTLERQGIFNVLLAQRRWVEAFEWAVLYLPEQAEQVLEKAANQMWAQGSCERLYRLLGQLPKTPQNSMLVLRWQFTALLELGREGEMLDEVRAVLAEQDAPELRAIYAIALYRLNDSDGALREARAAVETKQNALTLYAMGFLLPIEDPAAAIPLLRDAIRQAELEEKLYESAQAALTISSGLTGIGSYQEASDWASWGLRLCDEKGLQNQQLRVELFNEWAFLRIILGDTAALENQLSDQAEHLDKVRPFTSILLWTTLSDLLLSEKRGNEALKIYRTLWNNVQRRQHYNYLADGYIRALLECNFFDEALSVASTALELTNDLPLVFSRRSRAAYAISLSMIDPENSLPHLETILNEAQEIGWIQLQMTIQMYRLRVLLIMGDKSKADVARTQLLERESLLDSNALHLWAGPSSLFQDVYTYLGETHYPLELRLLGKQEVLIDGVPVQMRRRFVEILTVLVLNPEGLNAEELLVAVYGDKGTHETMRSDLSRLRELVPISAKPYRIQVPVKADFVELQRLISRGKVREALRLYQGSLFTESFAPALGEERQYLDNVLRQSVLVSGDAEALMGLAQKLKNDLEVWEEAIKYVAKNDPRRVLAQARVQNVSSHLN